MHKIMGWIKEYQFRLIISFLIIALFSLIIIDRAITPDYTIVIYQSYTTTDNQTYKSLEPFAQVNMDKGSFFTWDGWTITVK